MKKFLFTLMAVLALPIMLQAQSVDDDLYFVPSKKKTENKETKVKVETAGPVRVETPTTVVTSNAKSTVVVRDRNKKTRDVDAYNRRYDSKDYTFSSANDTLYIEERPDSDLDGEWVSGFDGSADDYEYATRIIRFRNPRYAVPISSPLYFDIVYGLNTFDWNVYYDGFYAYAFPTFSNRLWWDWRFNSYGWGWSSPYFGWSFGWGSWYGPFWYGHHHHYHWGGWYGPAYHHHPHYATPWRGVPRGSYTNRTSMAPRYASSTRAGSSRPGVTARRSATRGTQTATRRVSGTTGARRTDGVTRSQSGGTSQRRVVGTRQSSTSTRSGAVRTGDASSSRRQTYTRPSSTRVTGSGETTQSSVRRTEATGTRVGGTSRTATATRSAGSGVSGSGQRATYSRGSSSSSTRREQTTVNTRSSQSNSSRGSYSSGSSSRSSYGGGGATRSSGGGGSRGGRR